MDPNNLPPALYLIPVGLSDASPQSVTPPVNIDIIRGLRYFIVENIRTARRWIRRCDPAFSFEGVEFYQLNTHTRPEEVAEMLEPLRRGLPMGVMSEAGCPAVADPGADVVAIAQRERIKVVPLVGPSSILMGLMGSGFNGQSFCFHGYLPVDEAGKREALKRLERESERDNRTQIFIETPYRNNALLRLVCDTLHPDTLVCVAADITSPDTETIVTDSVAGWKKAESDYSKRPAIFLMYRSGDNRLHLSKGGKKRR